MSTLSQVLFKLLEEGATCPSRATDGSAGFDIYANGHYEIYPGAHALIPAGIACAIPEGWAGFIWPRSGMAVRYGVDRLAGLIDSDYRKEVHVSLINHGERMIEIRRGDRIAQMVVGPYLGESAVVDELPDPGTRDGGFGSTGQ